MKFNPLHNFISPVTGRVKADTNYVLVGDREGIATASSVLIDQKIDIQNLQHAADNIPVEIKGAIDLKGKLSALSSLQPNVLTSTFAPNPVFTGDSLHLPYGSTAERPLDPKEGMFRYNDEEDLLEYFNGSVWASLTSSAQPINISKDFATDMVYGVIANVNGGFDGFASLERDVDIRIQSSYYTKLLGDQSTASLSLLDRYDNGYINKTVSSSNGFFDYLLQKQDNETKTDLLKFDNKVDEFIFNKHISYKGKNIIKYDEAVDMVTGVLNNSGIGSDGFATANKVLDIRIQSSYYVDGDSSHTSLSFLDRYENGYFFENSTNNDWSNDFSFNSINSEIKTELFKYDSVSNKFVFNKLVEVPYPISDQDAVNKLYVDNAAGVKNVLGTTGQIFSSGGQYPQISLIETGISARTYTLATVTYDEFGRAISASDGQAVTSITAGAGLTGGIITNSGTLAIAPTGVTAGTYNNTNLQINDEGRILSVSESNTIGRIAFYGNNIATSTYNEDMRIDPGYAGGGGDVYINANTSLQNGSYFRLYDDSNVKYTEIRSPSFYSQPSTWKLPITEGQKDQFIKMGDNNQLEWTTIVTDAGVTRIDTGYGLYGGPIYDVGTIALSSTGVYPDTYTNPTLTIDGAGRIMSASNGQSANLGNFQFNGNTIKTTTPDIYLDASNGTITAYDRFDFEEAASFRYGSQPEVTFAGRGYLYVGSDGKLRYQNTQGTYIIAG